MSLFTNRRSDDQPAGAASTTSAAIDAGFWATEEWEEVETVASIEPAGTTSQTEVPPAPKRRLDDDHRAHAGNVEIDVAGLLEMLDIDDADDLAAISEAWQRFLAEHQPVDGDDDDAAELKERIRREINTAYASFRLTRAA